MQPVALTIAGSDPSGGAGIQADLKIFHQHGVYGAAVVTLITVQNSIEVRDVQVLDARMVAGQLTAVLEVMPPAAAKTGALGSTEVVRCVAAAAARHGLTLVVDPVMAAHVGGSLLDDEARTTLVAELLPLATLVTPNVPEAEALTGIEILGEEDLTTAAATIASMGPRHVLIKGGHLPGPIVDLLWSEGRVIKKRHPRIDTPHLHGTGCVLSAAITARLALGDDVAAAVAGAQEFVQRAIASAPHLGLGRGRGPLNLHVGLK